jgi:hypothetical protein
MRLHIALKPCLTRSKNGFYPPATYQNLFIPQAIFDTLFCPCCVSVFYTFNLYVFFLFLPFMFLLNFSFLFFFFLVLLYISPWFTSVQKLNSSPLTMVGTDFPIKKTS